VRYASGLAAELYTMRMSMVLALAGFVVFAYGFRQLLRWWLPFTVLWLSVPLPELVISSLALPLQFRASAMGASLLEWRGIPVFLNGNVIMLPGGHQLFVAEACSGLRSLTSLLSLAVLLGGMVLRWPASRILLVVAAIPIAIVINGVRVFLTGFFVFFVSPAMAEGFMHTTEGWLMFLVAFVALGVAAWLIGRGEQLFGRRREAHADA
jgi:exosortase